MTNRVDLTERQRSALAAAWDTFDMACHFGALSERRGGDGVKLSWALSISCGALWSAVNIAQEHVLGHGRRRGETDDWFTDRDLAAIKAIRHGGVHFSDSGSRGIGASIGDDGVELFVILPDDVFCPIDDFLILRARAQEEIEKFLEQSGGGTVRIFSFSP